MKRKAHEYRQQSDKAETHAETVQDFDAREAWRKVAIQWRELAALAERNDL
jgi:hypothetical protein